MRNGHVAMRGQVLLTKSPKSGWERKKREREQTERDGGREGFRERGSTFSLRFPAIGPLASGEARSKVVLHCKDYTWVPVLGSFDKLRKGRSFSPTCFTFCLRAL